MIETPAKHVLEETAVVYIFPEIVYTSVGAFKIITLYSTYTCLTRLEDHKTKALDQYHGFEEAKEVSWISINCYPHFCDLNKVLYIELKEEEV